jgi:hypothetical protein
MPDAAVKNPETVTGRKGTSRGGGGVHQTQGGGSSSSSSDDGHRLAQILLRISKTLKSLVYLKPPIIPPELQTEFAAVWNETEGHLATATATLQGVLPTTLIESLAHAGLTGPMLLMKEKSINFHLQKIDDVVVEYTSKGAILTYPERPGLIRRLLFLVKPGFEIMNSILGSVPASIFPGKEIVKEVKEHVKASYESVEAIKEELKA